MTQNPYVFAVGCPRSGTTLLQRVLDAHSQLAIVNETGWITELPRARRHVTASGHVTEDAIDALSNHPRFARLGLPSAKIMDLIGLPYPAFVSSIFDRVAKACGKPLAGDKTPRYVAFVDDLHGLFPAAKFVHLVRDGRDVCVSALSWEKADRFFRRFSTWPDNPVATVALWWARNALLGRESAARLPAHAYTEVRYERLASEPAPVCEAVCAFLELPYDAAMLRFHEGRVRTGAGLTTKRRWLPPTAGVRDWRSEMASADVSTFEAAARDVLDELGYEIRGSNGDHNGVASTENVKRRFIDDLRRRRRRVPQAWST